MEILFLLALLVVAYCTGSYSEKKHLASIRIREAQAPRIPVLSTEKDIPAQGVRATRLVSGSTVVGVDYFRNMLGGLINLFGGRITIFESVLDRARREALLRMRQEAAGASFIGCVRYETTFLNDSERGKSPPTVAIIAYGTAFYTDTASADAIPAY